MFHMFHCFSQSVSHVTTIHIFQSLQPPIIVFFNTQPVSHFSCFTCYTVIAAAVSKVYLTIPPDSHLSCVSHVTMWIFLTAWPQCLKNNELVLYQIVTYWHENVRHCSAITTPELDLQATTDIGYACQITQRSLFSGEIFKALSREKWLKFKNFNFKLYTQILRRTCNLQYSLPTYTKKVNDFNIPTYKRKAHQVINPTAWNHQLQFSCSWLYFSWQ